MLTKNYETYIIVDGNFEDTAVEEIISKYETLLKKNGAEIKNTERIGRKRLAYPINNKQNGYYILIEFTAKPESIAALDRAYKLDENIMRSLTVYMSSQTLKEKDEYLKKRALNLARAESEAAKKEQEPAAKGKSEGAAGFAGNRERRTENAAGETVK